jgi:hypothetical protein
MVNCAFTAGQTFDFAWTDAAGAVHAASYRGSLGLAPAWATKPLDLPGQEWVSACLAARVNALGATVSLSLRGQSPALACTAADTATHPKREAVFFGNLFTSSPAVYSCYDPLTSSLAVLNQRVCGEVLAGLVPVFNCGPIQILGPCDNLLGIPVGSCTAQDPACGYLYNCSPPHGSATMPSITTFLTLL